MSSTCRTTILDDPIYSGHVWQQSMLFAPDRDPNKPITDDEYGWRPLVWEKPTLERFQKSIMEVGKELDGKVKDINLSDSSIDISTENADGTMSFSEGFSSREYVEATRNNMRILAASFQESIAMVYLNFLLDDWLPQEDKGYMHDLFAEAQVRGMGAGGSDLMPYCKGHMLHTYSFFNRYPDDLVKGMAVQDTNLRQINPRTEEKNTVKDILDFAENYLGLDYIF